MFRCANFGRRLTVEPYHFVYRVENSRFFLSQFEFSHDQSRDVVHHRFITDGAWLDVLTKFEPNFALVRRFARDPEPDEV